MTVDVQTTVRNRMAQLLREAPSEADAIEFDRRWWSWGRLRATAAALDAALGAAGVGAAGRVAVVMENRPEIATALLALLAGGRCVVAVSPLQPPDRLARDIAAAAAPALVASSAVLDRAGVREAASGTGLVLELEDDGTLVAPAGAVAPDAPPNPGVSVEMLTSGTTGPPKRVYLTDRQMDVAMVSSGQVPREGQLLRGGVGLVTTPMVHIGGLWGILSTLYAGRRAVLMPRWQLEPWVETIERHRPRASGLVPAAIRTVMDAGVPVERLASLQAVTCGTAACPAELADAFQRRYGARVLMTYGATEFAGAVAGWTLPLNLEWWDRKAGSAGRAFPGVELRVTSPDGDVLPAGTTGRLEIRTQQSPDGGEGWLRTSDLADVDEDGFLWIRGRADDVIIRGGFKVAPDVVKRALEKHPAVAEAAVAGKPDHRLGQVPVAAVEAVEGMPPPSSGDLLAICRRELTAYEVPVEVLVVDELPRGPSMKVSRLELLALFDVPLTA